MSKLAELGVVFTTAFESSTITVGSVDVSNKHHTKITMKLPNDTQMHASFRKESWGDAVVKVFKKELQTGDAEFDKLVYITTDTPDLISAWLAADDVRGALGLTIETGGTFEIDGRDVIARAVGYDSADDASILSLVTSLVRRSA